MSQLWQMLAKYQLCARQSVQGPQWQGDDVLILQSLLLLGKEAVIREIKNVYFNTKQ